MNKAYRIFIWGKKLGIAGTLKVTILCILKKLKINYTKVVGIKLKERENRIFYIRAKTTDIDILESIFVGKKLGLHGEYDFLFKRKDLLDAKVIIDAGANIGAFSVLADLYCKNARIIAVEPEKNNFAMLVHNTRNCNNIECLNLGIWKYKTRLKVIQRETGEWGFIVKECTQGDIKALGIKDLIKKYSIEFIDILKVDIEGSELEMFEGNCEWLQNVKIIVIETHDRIRPGCTELIDKKIKSYGFTYRQFGEDRVYIRKEK